MARFLDLPAPWTVFCSTRITFGEGCFREVGSVAAGLGRKACVVTSPGLADGGAAEECVALLRAAGCSSARIDASISSEPGVEDVDRIAAECLAAGEDLLVAVGGGSVMDAAKAASMVAVQGGEAEEYLDGGRAMQAGSLPLVTVPTTAGTGAEISAAAVLSRGPQGLKKGLRGAAVAPTAALVDPDLTATAPAALVRVAGFDVFTHAVETFVSVKATPLTELFSLEAVEGVCRALPALLLDHSDRESRAAMSFYSMLMGFNLTHASTCLPHRLQYALGGAVNQPHALGLAALYPAWFELVQRKCPERLEQIELRMRRGLEALLPGPVAGSAPAVLDSFMEAIELSVNLGDLGVTEASCAELASRIQGRLENDRCWGSDVDPTAIYRACLERKRRGAQPSSRSERRP